MKFYKLLTIIFSIILLSSCTFSEEITLNEDGSGKYNLNMDMSAMMGMMGSLKDSTDTEAPQKIDTIMNLKDIMEANQESISDLSDSDKATYEALKDMKIHMKMDEEGGIMIMDFLKDFTNVSELNDIQEKVKMAQQLQENKVEESQPTNQKVTFTYSKKSFKRNVEILKLSPEDQAKFDENLEQSMMFLSSSTYKIKYNFPHKIKSVNLKGAVISEDGKTLTYETVIDSIMKNPKLLDFEVKF